jgi:hypothetical protein
MGRTIFATIAAPLLAIALLQTTPATAQRVFVAAQGSDANPCTFALPCRTFQHAHDVVAAGGEIDVLDPAGYGILTITKAISIQGHGFSGISVADTHIGININAAATDAISLNGLLIDGGGNSTLGIQFNSGRSLVVENCVIRNMSTVGIAFNSSALTLQTLSVSKSQFAELGIAGILVDPSDSGPVTVAIDRSAFYSSFVGLLVSGGPGNAAISVAMTDSIAAGNGAGGGAGIEVFTGPGSFPLSEVVLTRSTVANNETGLLVVGAAAVVRLANSTVTGNTTGYNAASGAIMSYGDNYIDDNGSNSGTLVSALKQ